MPFSTTDHVFISYNRKDTDVMRRIVSHLRGQGVSAWVDNEKLVPGTPIWEREIEKAIKGAFAIVVVLSPDAKESVWVLNELTLADEFKKRVFPVLVRGDFRDSIPFRLVTRQFVDIRSKEESGLESLSVALNHYLDELKQLEEERQAAEQESERQKQEEAKRLAVQKAEEERLAKAKLKAEQEAQAEKKAKEEAERLAAQKAEKERAAQAKREADRLTEGKRRADNKAREEKKAKKEADRLAAQKAEVEKKAETADKQSSKDQTDDDQTMHEMIEAKVNTTIKTYSFEARAKDLLAATNHFFSTGKRKYIGISAVAVIVLAGIGFNIFKNQVPPIEEHFTPTETVAPIVSPTYTMTKTLTATPTRQPTSTSTKTMTPTSTANLAATQRAVNSAATENSADDLLTQANHWNPKLSDTFSNNNNDWHTTTITGEWGKGEVRVTDGKYRWTYTAIKGSIYRVWKYTVSLSDFYLTVDGQETGTSTSGELGIVFRNSEAGDYYYFGINPSLQAYFFSLNYGDEWSSLIDYTYFPSIYSDKPNKLSVIAQGSQFTFFINNKFATEITDDTLPYGPIGLAIALNIADESSVFEFDNFELRTP